MTIKQGHEIPTIDCVLVTIKPNDSEEEIGLNTANKIGVEVVTSTTEAVQLIVKGKLLAQKPQSDTITGHTITLTDNVFNYELAQILQGGELTFDETLTKKPIKYTPPKVGDADNRKVFTLTAYSAVYNAAGVIVNYEKISYPNCKGRPFGLSSEDNVFRVSELVIDSAPDKGQAPFTLETIATEALPTVTPAVDR